MGGINMKSTLRYAVLTIFFAAVVLFAACSEPDDTESDREFWTITGYYMRANFGDLIIFEQKITSMDGSTQIYYDPVEFYFNEGEAGDVPVDSLKTGDKIELDVKKIAASYPGFARAYGLRLIETGDVSNIDDSALLELEECGIHAVIGERSEQPLITRSSGYFVSTETDCFLIPSAEYGTLADIDLLKITPAPSAADVSFDSFKTGDRIWVDIMLIQELYPPIAPLHGAVLIENGDISNIDGTAVSKLEELGYSVIK